MPAFIISDVTIKDEAAVAINRARAAASIARYGGRYLVRGGEVQRLEGDWSPNLIVVEFPDRETAQAWYRSPEYAAALELRDRAISRNLILVEGSAPAAGPQ
jgi:uncharacterized protein (DUF1330 family)